MGALEEAHLAAVAACGCDDEEDKEDLLAELGVGGGEAPGDAMEPAACALLAGLDEDDRREGLRRTPKRVAKAFHDGTAAAAAAAMPFTPGPYSGKSTLALVASVSAVGVGVVYGSVKLGILKCVIRHAICSACHGMLVNKDKCHVLHHRWLQSMHCARADPRVRPGRLLQHQVRVRHQDALSQASDKCTNLLNYV